MNRDLEEQLNELGPDYRAVVARLKSAGETAWPIMAKETRGSSGTRGWLIAASVTLVVGLGVALGLSCPGYRFCHARLASPCARLAPREYRASVDEMIATQNADGSWQNDFLTRRNADALKSCGDPAAQVAYKKALRNLRAHGVL